MCEIRALNFVEKKGEPSDQERKHHPALINMLANELQVEGKERVTLCQDQLRG
jgi:hypothetical protein